MNVQSVTAEPSCRIKFGSGGALNADHNILLVMYDERFEREGSPVTLQSIYRAIVEYLPPVYLLSGWAISGWYFFHYTIAVATLGIFSGTAFFAHYNVMTKSNIVEDRNSNELDRTAKIALILASLGFCAVFVGLMIASWTAYEIYAATPLFAVGMVYVPAFVLGVASAVFVKLIAEYLSNPNGAA